MLFRVRDLSWSVQALEMSAYKPKGKSKSKSKRRAECPVGESLACPTSPVSKEPTDDVRKEDISRRKCPAGASLACPTSPVSKEPTDEPTCAHCTVKARGRNKRSISAEERGFPRLSKLQAGIDRVQIPPTANGARA